jgi:predicted amidohydrolase
MDAEKTVHKVCDLIAEASAEGAELVVFPECTVPMYPAWPHHGAESAKISGKKGNDSASNSWQNCWSTLVSESLTIDGQLAALISNAAARANAVVVIGVVECEDSPGGPRLYNTALVFDADGELVARHRKLFPVLHEKLYFTPGDCHEPQVCPTRVGRIGIGICFENIHPAYRYNLLKQGEEIHCALWVSTEPDKDYMTISARQHAIEGGVFVVAAGQYTSSTPTPGKYGLTPSYRLVGGSMIVGPRGEILEGPDWDGEKIMYSWLEESSRIMARSTFDLLGRDGRPELYGNRGLGSWQ